MCALIRSTWPNLSSFYPELYVARNRQLCACEALKLRTIWSGLWIEWPICLASIHPNRKHIYLFWAANSSRRSQLDWVCSRIRRWPLCLPLLIYVAVSTTSEKLIFHQAEKLSISLKSEMWSFMCLCMSRFLLSRSAALLNLNRTCFSIQGPTRRNSFQF